MSKEVWECLIQTEVKGGSSPGGAGVPCGSSVVVRDSGQQHFSRDTATTATSAPTPVTRIQISVRR